ncbi:MAG TPA: patatin-like protein [Stellaceae bacterium]|nr:patatin-like protein [Stellaceae bacterium]
MREKELRLALVCFGGVSLAIYMHGISKEILKLVRASASLHGIADRTRRPNARFFDAADSNDPEFDTEAIYFEILREIGHKMELRVVVDIVAGASAGGINGTMLARALTHDLPMDKLRDLWLDKADVNVLLAREAKAKWWSKWFLQPFIWAMAASGALEPLRDHDALRTLSLFLRSRWFKPPLDGMVMAELMYDALASMGRPRDSRASLLPSGQGLDLFVTVTDHYGYQQLLQIHDPPLIREREHRHTLRFTYRRWPSGAVESDFDLENAPALAFAARATSSFPGAFPPAQIAEIDRLTAERGLKWPRRQRFITENFARYVDANIDPSTTSFVDGSILNNKPFHEAIGAIRGRPAYREVDRRLVFVEPDPAQPVVPVAHGIPGFFAMLKGALSDIPRNEPIADEIDSVNGLNERVRRLKAIVELARPQITELVNEAIGASLDAPLSAEQIRGWRERMNARAAVDAGFAYEGYVRLKLASVNGFIAQLILTLRGVAESAPLARAVREIVNAWARRAGMGYHRTNGTALHAETPAGAAELPRWIRLLLRFDVDFRKRRLSFLIQGQNRLYELLEEPAAVAAPIDRLKRDFYQRLELLRRKEKADFFSPETRDLVHELFAAAPSAREANNIEDYARRFVERNERRIGMLIDRLGDEIDLDASTDDVDRLLVQMQSPDWEPAARQFVLVNYLGFAFWDILTFSVTSWRDVGEFDEILVDRISPADVHTFSQFGVHEVLKGTGFAHFAAFLSRAYRENDYLIGRLHAADRLIDIVCNSAGADAVDGIDVLAMKRRAFEAILDREERHVPDSADLVARLRAMIASMASRAAR